VRVHSHRDHAPRRRGERAGDPRGQHDDAARAERGGGGDGHVAGDASVNQMPPGMVHRLEHPGIAVEARSASTAGPAVRRTSVPARRSVATTWQGSPVSSSRTPGKCRSSRRRRAAWVMRYPRRVGSRAATGAEHPDLYRAETSTTREDKRRPSHQASP
jgi:hypothetical protein